MMNSNKEKITFEIERIIIKEKPRKLKQEYFFEVAEAVYIDIPDEVIEQMEILIMDELNERKD